MSLLLLVLVAGGCVAARPPASMAGADGPVGAMAQRNAPRLPDGALATVSGTGEIRGLAPADAAREALRHDYILLGEAHTSACDHLAQAAFLTAMLAEGGRPAVGLEMVPRDGQPALDAFSRGGTPLADLPAALDWAGTWGYDFELYRPVFAVADWARLPVYGLNVPQRVVRQVSRGGLEAVDEADRVWLPPSIIPPAPEQRAALAAIFQEHAAMRAGRAGQMTTRGTTQGTTQGNGGSAPLQGSTASAAPAGAAGAFERFVLVQSLWDSAMAHQAVRVRVAHGGPVVILAGGGHVGYGWGIARRIRLLDPDARVLTVMPWRTAPGADSTSPPTAAGMVAALADSPPDAARADMFWVCRAMPEARRPMPGVSGAGGAVRPRLGLLLRQEPDGVRVEQVEPGSLAERAGFLPGDHILRVGDRVADSLRVLHEAGAAAVAAGRDVRFTVRGPGDTDSQRVLTVPGARP